MSEFRARVGRIRMKNGGADVRVLERPTPNPNGESYCGAVIQNAKAVASFSTKDSPLIGYILIGFYGDASTSVGFRYDQDRCVIPRSLVPAWTAEVIRRDMVTAPECREIFDQKFEWREGV